MTLTTRKLDYRSHKEHAFRGARLYTFGHGLNPSLFPAVVKGYGTMTRPEAARLLQWWRAQSRQS